MAKKKIKGRMKRTKGGAMAGMSTDQTGTQKGPQASDKYARSGAGEPKQTESHGKATK